MIRLWLWGLTLLAVAAATGPGAAQGLSAANPNAAQDFSAGARAITKCLPCHTIGEGAEHRLGPILNGLDGRKAGTFKGYTYSDANKASGIVWTKKTFTEYMRNPKAMVPGTKMMFVGIKSETEIVALWAYISQYGPDGKIRRVVGSMAKPEAKPPCKSGPPNLTSVNAC